MRSKRRKNQQAIVTVEGVVAFAEWSEDGSDTQLVILTDDDEEYFIETRDSSIKPSRFEGARVQATGRLFERDDWNILEIKRVRIVKFKDFDEDDEARFDYQGTYDDDVGENSWSDYEDLSDYARFIKGFGA